MAAAHDAGIQQIDYLLITHFHPDHDGGVTELSELMPIRVFIDHGGPSPAAGTTVRETNAAFRAYSTLRRGGHHLHPATMHPLPFDDADVTAASSAVTPH